MFEKLTSPQNQYIKRMRSLSTRKGREKTNLMPVEGVRFVAEALDAARRGITSIDAVFCEEGFEESIEAELVQAMAAVGARTFSCPSVLFKTLVDTETPQGIAAAVAKPTFPQSTFAEEDLYLVVDRVQDPGNLGTMIRTAAAAGANAIFCLKGTVDPYNPKVLRATMGSIFRVPVKFTPDAKNLVRALRRANCQLVAADIAGHQYHFEADYTNSTAIIVGNEGQGIQPALLEAADLRVQIPLAQKVESLNAAVACGILLYEVVRFRRTSGQ